MPFIVVAPPDTDEALAETGRKILETALSYGHRIDTEGFLQAWIRGVRVFAETDDKGDYIGVAFVMMGDRWLFTDRAASVLLALVKDKDGLIQFVRSVATAMGASKVIYEDRVLEDTKQETVWAVRELKL